jgi:tripartite-type tricarboxylate transporter receptor subunit TctC
MPFYEIVGQPGIQFKSAELSWLGSLTQTITVVSVWHATGVRTIEDAKQIEVVMGATGAGGTMAAHPALLNNTLGTRFKIVTGYEGGNAVSLAIERGEVEGRAATPWATWKTTRPQWVRDGKIVPLVQMGAKKDPELPHVPLLTEFAQNDEQRRMFEFVAATTAMDQPFAGPPGIPLERLTILRRAFDRMTEDPAFRADAARLDLEIDPLRGEEVEKIVAQIMRTPPAIVEKVKAAMTVTETAMPPGGSSSQEGAQ